MNTKPVIASVIIVNYNVKDILKDALDSLAEEARSLSIEVVVVDNQSTDGSIEMLANYASNTRLDLKYVASQKNLGFVGGSNLGADLSCGKYLIFLNPDTVVKPGSIKLLTNFLDANPNVGVVGPRIVYGDGTLQLSHSPIPTVSGEVLKVFNFKRIFLKLLLKDRDKSVSCKYREQQNVGWVSGACLLIPRTLFRQLDSFDKNIFMYAEDADLCIRVHKLGYKVVYYPNAEIIHFAGKSSQKVRPLALINGYKSHLYYFRKHKGRSVLGILRLSFSVASLLKAVAASCLGIVSSREYFSMAKAHYLASARVWTLKVPDPGKTS